MRLKSQRVWAWHGAGGMPNVEGSPLVSDVGCCGAGPGLCPGLLGAVSPVASFPWEV